MATHRVTIKRTVESVWTFEIDVPHDIYGYRNAEDAAVGALIGAEPEWVEDQPKIRMTVNRIEVAPAADTDAA